MPKYADVLHPIQLQELVRQWLKEDCPSFDVASTVVGTSGQEEAAILCKSPGVLAGVPFVNEVLRQLDLVPDWLVEEGATLEPEAYPDGKRRPLEVCRVTGSPRNLLLAERVLLNCLCRASGVCTAARQWRNKLLEKGWQGVLAGTRKTTPGFRMVEKYALLVAEIDTHRYDLSTMPMIKDNHVYLLGSVERAVKEAKKLAGFTQKVEVECSSLEEAREAALAGADVVMLDNATPKGLHSMARAVKAEFPHVLIEASGGITFENVTSYATDVVDVISTSALVQGYSTIDFSMKIKMK